MRRSSANEDQACWLQCIKEWFPERHTRTYFVPEVYMNKVPFASERLVDDNVLVYKEPEGRNTEPALHAVQLPSSDANTARRGRSMTFVRSSSTSSVLTRTRSKTSPATPSKCARKDSKARYGSAPPSSKVQTSSVTSDKASAYSLSSEPITVYDSEVRDDRAQQHVLCCLQELVKSQPEPMVVISQMRFQDYLSKCCYEATRQHPQRPRDIQDTSLRRGEFDILIIHMIYGLVVLEIKSVLENKEHTLTEDAAKVKVTERVRKAIGQMNKEEKVLLHLVNDLARGVRVSKTLVLPTVTRTQLRNAVEKDSQLQKDFCECLGNSSSAMETEGNPSQLTACIDLCLCSDQLSAHDNPSDVTPDVLDRLKAWWQRRIASKGPDKVMTPDLYDSLLARFCGPATTITVPCTSTPPMEMRTHTEAVSETGERVSRIALVPEQVKLLRNMSRRMLVTGPPGTGKTVILVLMGKQWLIDGHTVHVISFWPGSYAACYMIFSHLQQIQSKMLPPSGTRRKDGGSSAPSKALLQFHAFNITEEDSFRSAVHTVSLLAREGHLHALADECGFDQESSKRCQQFCKKLYKAVGDGLHLWMATMFSVKPASCMAEQELKIPLRCPPNVVQAVKEAPQIRSGKVRTYSVNEVTAPCQGPQPLRVYHHSDESEGHRGNWPYDCLTCASVIVQELKQLVGGGSPAGAGSGDTPHPPPLQYGDVMILARQLHAIGTLQEALTSAGIHHRVVQADDTSGIEDMACARSDHVTITSFETARGLERKVVVVVEREWEAEDGMRLFAMSRCTSLLLWFSRRLSTVSQSGLQAADSLKRD